MATRIKRSRLSIKKKHGPEKSGHEISFVDYKPKNERKIPGIYKRNKEGKPAASVIEVALSALVNHDLPRHSPELTGLVKKGNEIKGVFVQAIEQFTTFRAIRDTQNLDLILNEMCEEDKPRTSTNLKQQFFRADIITRIALLKSLRKKITLNTALEETHRELARCLAVSYFYQDDDLHLENIGMNKDGTLYRIDFDMAFYRELTSKVGQMRTYPRLVHDRFHITENDLRNFPELTDAVFHYFPTTRRIFTGGLPFQANKGYTKTDNAAFANLKNSDIFKQELYKTLLTISLNPAKSYEQALKGAIDDIPLRDCLLRITTARQKYLHSVLLTLRDQFNPANLKLAGQLPGFNTLQSGDSPLHIALKTNGYQAEETLQHFFQHITHINSAGETPLMIAAQENNIHAARELLESKPGCFMKMERNHIPRSLAIALEQNNFPLIALLIEKGAINVFCTDKDVFELIEYCVKNQKYDIASLLIKAKFGHKIPNQLLDDFYTENPEDKIAKHFFSMTMGQLEQNHVAKLLSVCEHRQQYNTIFHLSQRYPLNSVDPATGLIVSITDLKEAAAAEHVLPVNNALEQDTVINILSHCEPTLAKLTHLKLKFAASTQDHNKYAKIILKRAIADRPDLNHSIALLERSAQIDHAKMLMESLEAVRENELSLKHKKKTTLTLLKYFLPEITDPQALADIHRQLGSRQYDYLRELTSRFWIVRWFRGQHGLTSTYKKAVSLMKAQSKKIIDSDKAHRDENKRILVYTYKDNNTWGLFFKSTEPKQNPQPAAQKNKGPTLGNSPTPQPAQTNPKQPPAIPTLDDFHDNRPRMFKPLFANTKPYKANPRAATLAAPRPYALKS